MEAPPSPGPGARALAATPRRKALVGSPGTDTTIGSGESPASPATPAAHTPRASTPRLPESAKKSPRSPSGKSLLNLSSFPASPSYSFRPPLRLGPAATCRKPPANPASAQTTGLGGLTATVTCSASNSCTEARASSPREAIKVTPGPGPGSYEVRTCIGQGPRAVLPPRCLSPSRIAKATKGPGPGAYETRSCIGMGKGPTFTLAPTTRGAWNQSIMPGPGEYDHSGSTLRASGSPRWGAPPTQRRVQTQHSEDVRGQGAHSMTSTSLGEGPKFSFSRSLREQPRSGTPGPGAYGGLYTTFRMQSPTRGRIGAGSAPAAG